MQSSATTATGKEPSRAVTLPPRDGDLLTNERVRLVLVVNTFSQERIVHDAPAGHSIAELLDQALAGNRNRQRILDHVAVAVEGNPIGREWWGKLRPKAGTITTARVIPRGGMRGIFQIFIAIAAIAVQFIPVLGQIGGAALALGIGLVGNLLLNALFPVRPPSLKGPEQEQRKELFSFSGIRNEATPFDPLPVVLGRHRVYARVASRPYTELVGQEQYFRGIFFWTYGPADLSELKIGETLLSTFEDVEVEHILGYGTETDFTLYPGAVFEESLSVNLFELRDSGDGWQQRTTAEDVDEWSYDLLAPQGLLLIDGENGKRYSVTVVIGVRYREVGAPGWTDLPDLVWKLRTNNPRRIGGRHVFPARGQYDLAWKFKSMDREVPDSSDSNDALFAAVVLTAFRALRNAPPITFGKPITATALRIRMTDQLNGIVDTLNAVVERRVTAFDGADWQPEQKSRNPGDLGPWVLQAPENARPYTDDQIHWPSWEGFNAYCTLHGLTFDQWRTGRTSVMDALADVCAAGRGSPCIIHGKQGVIWDQPESPIVQHFTPRNSSGYQGRRLYRHWPHAWRAKFVNEAKGYNADERIIYADGYDADNATRFEGIEFPGVTVSDTVWKLGRFQLAQARLRPELANITTDFEHLVCTRGDRVRVSYDVPRWGIQAARVKAVTGALPQTVTLDELILQAADGMYAVRFRLQDGSTLYRSVVTVAGQSKVLRLVGDGTMPGLGALAMFGEADLETVVCRVHSIEAMEDLAARVYLVDDAPAISEADQGEIPPYDSQITIPPDPLSLPPVSIQVSEFVYFEDNGVPREAAKVVWQVQRFGNAASFEVQYRDVTTGESWQPGGSVPSPQLMREVRDLDTSAYRFRVRAIFTDGSASGWVESEDVTLSALSSSPADVENFRVSVLGNVATLTWDPVPGIAVRGYKIKYSPALSGATWGSSVTLLPLVEVTSAQVPARAGTYLIKALLYGGLESDGPTLLVTNIAILDALNVVEFVEEDPDWLGAMVGVVFDSGMGGIRLADISGGTGTGSDGTYLREGFYYFAAPIDLGAVFTSRVTVTLEAFGVNVFDDLFAREDFFEPEDFFDIDPSDWEIRIEIALSDLAAGASGELEDWQPYQISDYTARAYWARLHFVSRRRGLTGVATRAALQVDMPDRVEGGNDLAVGTGGLRVDFLPPFIELKGLGIAAQDMATGDYYTLTSKDETGFDIIFRNAAGTAIARTFDYVAKGYGKRLD